MQTTRLFLSTYLTIASRVFSPVWSTRIPAVLFILLCCGFVQANAQTNVFGPETYTRGVGTPVPVTKTFTVQKPEGPFDVIVESTARVNERRLPINAIIQLNGTEIVGTRDANEVRIVKSVNLKQENQISVQVIGTPDASIVLKISPGFKYVLYTNPQEPLVLSGESSDGRTVEYFGEKGANGYAKAVTSMRVTTAKGETVDYFFNKQSRLTEIRSFTGLHLKFKWTSPTIADVTISDANGSSQVTAPIDFSKLSGQSALSDPVCPACPRTSSATSGVQRNHADLSRLTSSQLDNPIFLATTNSALSAVGVEEACLATAEVLTKICDGLTAIQMGGINSQVICIGLAAVASSSVYGIALVPLIWKSCELVMLGAELGCAALELSNQFNKTEPICNRISQFFTGVKNFVLGKGILVSASLQLSPSSNYLVGQPIAGTFSIANRNLKPVSIQKLLIGGRVGGYCPSFQCPDFTAQTNISLSPGQVHNYSGTFTPSRTGNYNFFVAYQGTGGKWVIPVAVEKNNKNHLNITVTELKPNVVVSKSLTLTPARGPFPLGQTFTGSFSITNRGNAPLTTRQIIIGGRVGGHCPNDVCPDFSPISPNVTLNPGQTFDYSGQITLSQPGSYTFYVAYQTPDDKWEMPVKPERGAVNQVSVVIQPPGPVLIGANPAATAASPNAQVINLQGVRLSNVLYAQLRLPNGKITYLYLPLNQVFNVSDEQVRIKAKFPGGGTYYITVWTANGKSNEYPLTVQ